MTRRRGNVIANHVRMNRSQHAGAFVLVEGRHDNLSCKQIVDTSRTKIVVAENKENVCEAIAVLDDDGFTGAVGLVDADFDHLEGIGMSSPNLVLTELHDLECVQLRAAGLAGLLAEFGSSSKLERLGRNVVDVLLLAARPLGCLRLYSQRQNLGLRFKGLRYNRFVNKEDLTVNEVALVEEVKKRSEGVQPSDEVLIEGMKEIGSLDCESWQLCNGNDVLGVLAIGLRHMLGSQKATDVRVCDLRQALRLGFRGERFEQTEVGKSFREWEGRNKDYWFLASGDGAREAK